MPSSGQTNKKKSITVWNSCVSAHDFQVCWMFLWTGKATSFCWPFVSLPLWLLYSVLFSSLLLSSPPQLFCGHPTTPPCLWTPTHQPTYGLLPLPPFLQTLAPPVLSRPHFLLLFLGCVPTHSTSLSLISSPSVFFCLLYLFSHPCMPPHSSLLLNYSSLFDHFPPFSLPSNNYLPWARYTDLRNLNVVMNTRENSIYKHDFRTLYSWYLYRHSYSYRKALIISN